MATDRYRLPELNAARTTSKPVLPTDTQSRRLLIALGLLLVVLAAVIVRNSDFWFGGDDVADVDTAATSESIPNPNPAPAVSTPSQEPSSQAVIVKQSRGAKTFTALKDATQSVIAKATQPAANDLGEPVVATHRVALPPLDVEVVAGDKHSTIHPGSNVIVTEIPSDPNRPAVSDTSAGTVTTNASQHDKLSAVRAPQLRQTLTAAYPALGQHSRVQGSVVLEAVIGTDGGIEGLRVISGPSILSNAAQQAVREWRFKPYLQDGRPVETKCTVTVNFSIRVAEESSNIS